MRSTQQISVLLPDGKIQPALLQADRVTLGRSTTNDLSYPEDTGLSRLHLVFERSGEQWSVQDAGSKNGTKVNGEQLAEPHVMRDGDQIAAGQLLITFGPPPRGSETVVFLEGNEPRRPGVSTVATDLASVLAQESATFAKLEPEDSVSPNRVGALIKAGRELANHRPLDELFEVILDLAIESVCAERGLLLTSEKGELVVRAHRGDNFRIGRGVRDRVLGEKVSLLVNDVQADHDFREMHTLIQQQVRMLMAVPLQTNDKVIGLIYVDCPHLKRQFTPDDLNLLTVMANVAAIRIEHARLAEIEIVERQQAKDLEQAAAIQRQLLPSIAPAIPGLDLAGMNVPSRSVGGDYYDFLPYAGGRLGLAIGDVSGKAMPAALLMTSLQARVHVLAEDNLGAAGLVARLNRFTAANCPPGRFVSFFFSLYHPETGELKYCNAGHNPPFLIRSDGRSERLEEGGLLLGIFPAMEYCEGRCRLAPGDMILLFSDGVTEAANADGDEFGDDRLLAIARANRYMSASILIEAIHNAVIAWTGSVNFSDDLTLVAALRARQ